MNILKDYETKVLHLLISSVMEPRQLDAFLLEVEFVSYEYTGSGYFLTLRHPSLPKARCVFKEPVVMGHADGIDCGFVVFIENSQLTLECHTWGTTDVPKGFRDKDVKIGTTE